MESTGWREGAGGFFREVVEFFSVAPPRCVGNAEVLDRQPEFRAADGGSGKWKAREFFAVPVDSEVRRDRFRGVPGLSISVFARRPSVVAVLFSGVLAGLAGSALPGCGARTKLYGAFPCTVEGERRSCVNECGAGELVCEGGFWGECQVDEVVERCDNACGEGTRTCEENVWSECGVAPVDLPCENDCGSGVQRCEEGVAAECVVPPATRECATKCGVGLESCESGAWFGCTAPQPLAPTLRGTIRDFLVSHPDFENESQGAETGIVASILGADGKPVYAGTPTTLTTTGRENFDQWFRDVPGVNLSTELELPLAASPNDPRLYRYENRDFFPIDGQLFGNEGNVHNFHFTFEAEGTFLYQGGEVFRFTGDDDVWVFVNERLIIDLGGTHAAMSAEVRLDDVAPSIGLVLGGRYPLKMFFAERHTVNSNFILETSIADLGDCP